MYNLFVRDYSFEGLIRNILSVQKPDVNSFYFKSFYFAESSRVVYSQGETV